MQNNYIKELSIKTFQEGSLKEYYSPRKSRFHFPSFFVGVMSSALLSLLL